MTLSKFFYLSLLKSACPHIYNARIILQRDKILIYVKRVAFSQLIRCFIYYVNYVDMFYGIFIYDVRVIWTCRWGIHLCGKIQSCRCLIGYLFFGKSYVDVSAG